MPRIDDRCLHCRAPLEPGDVVVFGGTGLSHPACCPPPGEVAARVLAHLGSQADGGLCSTCLALSLNLDFGVVRSAVRALQDSGRVGIDAGGCRRCSGDRVRVRAALRVAA
jgi:hypothetical protein